jgi:acetyl esterase
MTINEQTTALDPDAQFVADQLALLLPDGLSGLGVEGVKEFGRMRVAELIPAGPDVASVTDLHVPGPHGSVPIRLYRPGSDEPLPVLVYLHGGGWTFGNLDGGADHLCRDIVSRTGIAVVSVDYRLAPEFKFPVPVDEATTVLRWLREKGDELGIDPTRIAIGGDSAGGNISAAVTHLDRGSDSPLRAQVLLYPATEHCVERTSWIENAEAPLLTTRDTVWFWDLYLRSDEDRTDPRATPASAEDFGDLPPALVVVARCATTVCTTPSCSRAPGTPSRWCVSTVPSTAS